MPAIHLVIADAKPPRETRHDCMYPGCRINLPGSVPACKRHRKAWQAARDAAATKEAS